MELNPNADKYIIAILMFTTYYGVITNRKPGVVLILERPAKDQRYLNRLLGVAHKYDIRVWVMSPEDLR